MPKSKKEKLVVIDGHALIHRAYHAIPPLTTKDGEPVNAVYGFAVILLKVIKDLSPKYTVVAFDLPGKTKRHSDYEEYKATRKAPPDDLKLQIGRVRELVETFNIPVIDKKGYEADDVIGTIVKKSPEELENYIVTGDLDELQLVDERTRVYTMKRGFSDIVIYNEAKVRERYGLTPDKFVDYKALKGDPSDNIPGVAGVGEKTATELIKRYGSLDRVYDNIEKIKPAVAKKLAAGREMAYLSKKLSTIETDLEISFDPKKCLTTDFDSEKILTLFRGLGFVSLVPKIPLTDNPKKRSQKTSYETIDDLKKLKETVRKLKEAKALSVDTETNSTDRIEAELVGISLSKKEKEAFYIPIGHKKGKQLEKEVVLSVLKPLLENKKILKVGHNLKYDYVVLRREGVALGERLFDTMLAAYLLNPTLRAQKLSSLAFSELGIETDGIETHLGRGKNQLTFDEVEIEKALSYAAADADIAFRLFSLLEKKLAENDLLELAEKIEFPLIGILGEMELLGIRVDVQKLRKFSRETEKKIASLKGKIHRVAGGEFNVASTQQLQKVLFERLKIHEKVENQRDLKKLKNGGFSTAASELEKLRQIHPIIKTVFDFRELSKLKNTYMDTLPKLVKKDGRLHTNYNQAITQTGRLSSSDPNLQNIPTRTKEGKKIKAAFVADEGRLLLSADYSQIELRIIAHIAKDRAMIETFKSDRDIHTETATGLYKVKKEKVTSEMRRAAKIVNFGILYGVSAHGLHRQVGVTREEGQELIERYFKLYPEIKKYSEEIVSQARELGYVETVFGRKRFLPEIRSKNFAVRGAAERMAVNMPIQGTAADLMKLAMIDISEELPRIDSRAKMLLQVHDELILEVPEKDASNVGVFVQKKMNKVAKFSVPIKTDISWGRNWGDLV